MDLLERLYKPLSVLYILPLALAIKGFIQTL